MKVIFIRGVPGVGKTVVSKILGKILSNSKIICVDNFNLEEMKRGKSFKKSLEIAHEKTLKELYLLEKGDIDYVILDEIICDRIFFEKLNKFLDETKTPSYWFRLMRPVEKLLEIESKRKRKIKNTQEDLFNLKKDIESCKIENEYRILNGNLALTIKKILNVIFN